MIKGRFYFKRTTSGNLIGEFSHHRMKENSTEGANRTSPDKGSFDGTYITTWSDNSTPQIAQMVITPKSGCTNIFTVEWTNLTSHKIIFLGEGMIVDGMLIGDYRN